MCFQCWWGSLLYIWLSWIVYGCMYILAIGFMVYVFLEVEEAGGMYLETDQVCWLECSGIVELCVY